MSKLDLFKTPLTHRSTQKNNLVPLQVCLLMQKMDRVASSAHVDLTKNVFNLMENQGKGPRVREDPVTKLKNLENKSQSNRASVELLVQRKPKIYSNSLQKNKAENDKKDYMKIFKQLKDEKFFPEENDEDNHSEDDEWGKNDKNEKNQKGPEGIKHYRLLREHPKLLNFAVQRIKSKDVELKNSTRKQQEQIMIKQASRPSQLDLKQDFKQIFSSSRKSQVDALDSPKAIVDQQLNKFYSKSTKGKIDTSIKDNPRCNYLLRRHERIMSSAEDNHVSKQNMKKLKERLNQIVNEINRNDKKGGDFLPRITTNASTFDLQSKL